MNRSDSKGGITVKVQSPLTVLIHNLENKTTIASPDSPVFVSSKTGIQKNVTVSKDSLGRQESAAASIIAASQSLPNYIDYEKKIDLVRVENLRLRRKLRQIELEEAIWESFVKSSEPKNVSLMNVLIAAVDRRMKDLKPLPNVSLGRINSPDGSNANLHPTSPQSPKSVETLNEERKNSNTIINFRKESWIHSIDAHDPYPDTESGGVSEDSEHSEDALKMKDNNSNSSLNRRKSSGKRIIRTISSERMQFASIPEDLNEAKIEAVSNSQERLKQSNKNMAGLSVKKYSSSISTIDSRVLGNVIDMYASNEQQLSTSGLTIDFTPAVSPKSPTAKAVPSSPKPNLNDRHSYMKFGVQGEGVDQSDVKPSGSIHERIADLQRVPSMLRKKEPTENPQDGSKHIKELENARIVSRVAAIFEQKSVEPPTTGRVAQTQDIQPKPNLTKKVASKSLSSTEVAKTVSKRRM